MRKLCVLAAGLVVSAACPALRADSGNEVIVVYNTRLPESKALAEYYAQRRNVPAGQVFWFALATNQDMSRAEFHDALQRPLAKLLEAKELWHIGSGIVPSTNGTPGRIVWKVKTSRIRYAVLCYGVPIRITPDPNLKESIEETARPELRRNGAAVDSELALLPCIEQNLPLAGPLSNPVLAATNTALFNPTNGVLMVARLDGPSAEIARGLVDKAIEAETHGLWGRAYFDLRGITDPGYKMGDDWIRSAADICKRLGFETVVDERPETFPPEFPMSQIAVYCGWYDPDVSGPFTRRNVEFMPGAFAYHLHSYSAANLRSATNNWVGPLLAKGATISMGCVDEPYLSGTPEVAVFVARLIFDRMTFGEAAYSAQPVLSWQTTIVGDPLYRPFGRPPERLQKELELEHSKLLEWSFLRTADLNLASGRLPAALAGYLERIPLTAHSAVLTEKLADLYQALGKPSSAIDTCERALILDPSPQQRVRLRLNLAGRLEAMNRTQDAYDDYVKLLQENTDYPNKLSIYRKLLPLVHKLGMENDAARYEELINGLAPPRPPPQPESKK